MRRREVVIDDWSSSGTLLWMRKASAAERIIPATEFKAQCLGLLDRVASSKAAIVVTKRGRPIARVVPIEHEHVPRSLAGSVTIVDPRDDLLSTNVAWEADVGGDER